MACLFAAKLRLKSEKMSLCARNGLSVQEEGRKKTVPRGVYLLWHSLFRFCVILLGLFHHAFDVEAGHLRDGVGPDGDSLLKISGEFSFSVISDFDFAFLARFDGIFGIGGHGASATGHGLIDDEGGFAYVGEGEGTFLNGIFLAEVTEVVTHLVEFDLGLLLCCGPSHECEEHHGE